MRIAWSSAGGVDESAALGAAGEEEEEEAEERMTVLSGERIKFFVRQISRSVIAKVERVRLVHMPNASAVPSNGIGKIVRGS